MIADDVYFVLTGRRATGFAIDVVSSAFQLELTFRTGGEFATVAAFSTGAANGGVGSVMHFEAPEVYKGTMAAWVGTEETISAIHGKPATPESYYALILHIGETYNRHITTRASYESTYGLYGSLNTVLRV